MRKKCYRCGRVFPDSDARFCAYCGSELAIDAEYEAEQKRIEAEQKRKREREEELERKAKEWSNKVQPYIRQFNSQLDELERYNKDDTFRYSIPGRLIKAEREFYSERDVKEEKDLERLRRLCEEQTAFLSAINNGVDSKAKVILSGLLEEEIKKTRYHIEKLKSYSQSGGRDLLLEFATKLLNGGRMRMVEESSIETEYSGATTYIRFEDIEPSVRKNYSPDEKYKITKKWEWLPVEKRTRDHDMVEVEEKKEVRFSRTEIMAETQHITTTYTWNSNGISASTVFASSQSQWGKSFLAAYTNLVWANRLLKQYTLSYGFRGDYQEIRGKLSSFRDMERDETRRTTKSFKRYDYYPRPRKY